MPHVRIDLHRIHEPRLAAFSDAILEGMVGGLQMPRDDQKQAAMSQIADGFEALGIKRDNLMLVVAEVHGAAWYAPGTAARVSKSMPGEV